MKLPETVTTLNDLFESIKQGKENINFLNYLNNGVWHSLSVGAFYTQTLALAKGLQSLGATSKSRIGILAYSSPHWLMMEFATHLLGAVSVPIFFNISSKYLEFELNDAQIDILFTTTDDKIETLLHSDLKALITLGISKPTDSRKHIVTYDELLEMGQEQALPLLHVKPDDLCTIIYTSGNTGQPKGVMLSHHALISQIKDTAQLFVLDETDVALSFLPLAHIFERMVMTFYLSQGISVYFADDVKNVAALLKTVNPTLMTVVPRLLEKVFVKIRQKVAATKGIRGLIAKFAWEHARNKPASMGKIWFDPLLDTLVYSKFREAFGTRLRMLICGGSALDPEIYNFLVNMGIHLYQGYGLSEFAPVISANSPLHNRVGTCGRAFPSVHTRLTEDGELLVKGPSMMLGYLNQPQKTAETIDEEGWLHTGDLATIDQEGFITIVGRKKELFKTSTGKYVSPIPMEQRLVKNPYIDFAVVIAEGKPYVTALLFPDHEYIASLGESDIKAFFETPAMKRKLRNIIWRTNWHCNKWEKIQYYTLITDPISIETGELTPSMKLSRTGVASRFAKEIQMMYEKDEQ